MRFPRLPARSTGDPSFWGSQRSYAERYQWRFVLVAAFLAFATLSETALTWAPPHPEPVEVSARVVDLTCSGGGCKQVATVRWETDGTAYEDSIRAPAGFPSQGPVELHQHPWDPSVVWDPRYYDPPALLHWATALSSLLLLLSLGHVVWRRLPRQKAPPPPRRKRKAEPRGPTSGQGRRVRRRSGRRR
ncbi:hypothetical protein ACWFMI_01865 [Nocardiopsis terrae]